MTSTSCQRCETPVPDHATLCRSCTSHLRRQLHNATWLWTELTTALTRQSVGVHHPAPPEPPDPDDEQWPQTLRATPMPFQYAASAAALNLRNALAGWTRLVVEERGGHYPSDNPPVLAGFLTSQLEWLRHHDAGPEALIEIGSAVTWAWRVIDLEAEEKFLGPCRAHGDDGPCPYDVYAPEDATSASCRVCGAVHDDVQARRTQLLVDAQDSLFTAAEIPTAVTAWGATTTPSTVSSWVRRGRLTAHGERAGRKVYRLGDVLDLLAAEAARQASTATRRSA